MNSKFNNNFKLREADRVEITTIMDNYTDRLLPSTGVAKRAPLAVGEQLTPQTPLAEHVLSLLIKVLRGAD